MNSLSEEKAAAMKTAGSPVDLRRSRRTLKRLTAVVFGSFSLSAFSQEAQDPELVNYKTGIDALWGGEKGTAYQEEYWYHDKLVNDTKSVWIRDKTTITFQHNFRNVASINNQRPKTVVGTGPGRGQIRYKIDGLWQELRWAPTYTGAGVLYPAYTSPFSLAETGVVGVTGWNSGGSFWQGMVDSAGDEWHVMMYADDDSDFSGFGFEGKVDGFDDSWASDGKYVLFCVNPKTPAMTVRASGTGQFYTTPAWTYWVPKIHDQSTYFQSSCTFEIRNIYGGNISYRVNNGKIVDVGTSTVTLNQDSFSDGSNTLEYWYTDTPDKKRIRKVVKNPSFPSEGESHGERVLGGNSGWSAFRSRASREPYLTLVKTARASPDDHVDWENKRRTGLRFGGQNWPHRNHGASGNALLAKYLGWNSYRIGAKDNKTYAAYAKEMLLESPLAQHPVGIEGSPWASISIPAADTVYRGYWDSAFAYNAASAYDILVGGYKSSDHEGGITPVEDYYLRDMLASWVHLSVIGRGGAVDPSYGDGMWEACRNMASLMITCVMPNYSTSYYGTSGLNGATTVHQWAPFQTYNYTWKSYFLDDDYALQKSVMVGPKFRLLIEGGKGSGALIYPVSESPAVWVDKADYASWSQCSYNLAYYANMIAFYGDLDKHASLLNYIDLITAGTLQGNKNPAGPTRQHMVTLLNVNFPKALSNMRPHLKGQSNGESSALKEAGLFGIAFYDDGQENALSPPSGLKVVPGR